MRTEKIKANNGNFEITITKDNEDVKISFDFTLPSNVTPQFTIPDWALPIEETHDFNAGVIFKGQLANKDVTYKLNAKIKFFNNLTFYPSKADTYKGFLTYIGEAPKDSGVILDGVRLTCISSLNIEVFPVMTSIKRNHEGNLITSMTMDSTFKRIFNITTLPLSDIPYILGFDEYSNTREQLENLLYSNLGNYKTLTYKNKDYIVLLSENIQETNSTAFIDGVLKDITTYTFTLEEV